MPGKLGQYSEGRQELALWGVFIGKEFHGAGPSARRYLALMFILFIAGLTSIALAPVWK